MLFCSKTPFLLCVCVFRSRVDTYGPLRETKVNRTPITYTKTYQVYIAVFSLRLFGPDCYLCSPVMLEHRQSQTCLMLTIYKDFCKNLPAQAIDYGRHRPASWLTPPRPWCYDPSEELPSTVGTCALLARKGTRPNEGGDSAP